MMSGMYHTRVKLSTKHIGAMTTIETLIPAIRYTLFSQEESAVTKIHK